MLIRSIQALIRRKKVMARVHGSVVQQEQNQDQSAVIEASVFAPGKQPPHVQRYVTRIAIEMHSSFSR
jgi:hypothetical protein